MLRAVAIGLVLFGHIPPLPPTGLVGLDAVWAVLQRGGWVGVDLFFVLSGFLVSGLLFREHRRHGSIRVGRFLIRRGFRIYPPFYVFLLISIVGYSALGFRFQPQMVIGELLYLQNYVGQIWGHTWSLAVEEHFYLLLPLLLLAVSRQRRGRPDAFRGVVPVYLAVAAMCLTLRWDLRGVPFHYSTHLVPTHLRIDSLLLGVVVAYVYHQHGERLTPWFSVRRRLALGGLGLGLVIPAFVFDLGHTPWLTWLGFWLFSVGFAAWLVAALGTRLAGRGWEALGFIGLHSYSIYLWHFPARLVVRELAKRAGGPSVLWCLAYAGLSLGVGIGMAKAIERPLIRLRDRRFPRREGALEAPAMSDR